MDPGASIGNSQRLWIWLDLPGFAWISFDSEPPAPPSALFRLIDFTLPLLRPHGSLGKAEFVEGGPQFSRVAFSCGMDTRRDFGSVSP